VKDFDPTTDLIKRTKQFTINIIKLSAKVPKTIEGQVITGRMVLSATSVAANYRAVYRARSRAEFIAKLGTVVAEADETGFGWNC
jgi:four helix bundle protein